MKKITVFSLVAATVLFTACGEKTKDAASSATSAVTEAVKADTTGTVDAAKKMAEDAASAAKEKATEVAQAAKVEAEKLAAQAAEKAAEVQAALVAKAAEIKVAAEAKVTETANALKEKSEVATETVTAAVTPDNGAGKAAYAKCAGCHGADGKTKALGKANIVAGQTVEVLVEALNGYKAGTRNVSGMGMLMKGQVASMDDATIKAVSEYMSGL